MKGSCECIDQAIADSRQGVVYHLAGWENGLTIPHLKKQLIKMYYTSLGLGGLL
jgi:hypothetical protein